MKYIYIALLFFISTLIFSQEKYKNYTSFLQKYVSNDGKVNYSAIKADKNVLDNLVKEFASLKPSTDKNEQLSYWINVYNINTIKLLTDNYPIKSIQNLDSGKPWDVKRISINGTTYSLNQIENDIIRAKYNDARIHFAVNCGAKSCPPLYNSAFEPKDIDNQLNNLSKKFINNPKFQNLNTTKSNISKIFEWYVKDFVNVITFINKYSNLKLKTDTKIQYQTYDWTLNDNK
jgi:Protein of unknown function, DUF547